MLLDAGADVNIQNKDGNTALNLSSFYSNTTSTEKIVKMLLDAGAHVNIQSKDGNTALTYSAYSNNIKTQFINKYFAIHIIICI
jgi:ankyrin repeat protein